MDTQKRYKWLLIVLLILLLIPYLYISKYANPVADDLIYAFNGKKNELAFLLKRDYFNWNGRYVSNVLVFTNPMVRNSYELYKLAPVLLILLTLVAYLLFIFTLFRNLLDMKLKLILSLLLCLLFLYQMPIISEGIYWYTGAVTYQLANIVLLIYITSLISYTQGKYILKNKIIHLFVSTCLLIACIGFNEIHMIVLLVFAFISLWIVYKNNLQHKSFFIFLLIVTLLFSAVMYFAPGNTARAGLASENHQLIHSLVFSLAQTIRFFLEWTSSIPLLVLSFLYYHLNAKLSDKILLFSRSFYLSPVYSCMLLFFIIFIAVFPPYWATGMLGQHRTLNVAYCLFLLLWFMNLTVCFNTYKNVDKTIKPLDIQLCKLLLVLVVISFSFTKNGYGLLSDIFYGKAKSYDEQMKERYALMRYPADTIHLHKLVDPPQTIFVNDITVDPANFLNKAYTLYFECENTVLMKK